MKIMIINPNSDPQATILIKDTARKYANGEFEVTCKPTPGASKFVNRYEDIANSVAGMIKIVRENEEDFDGFIVAGGCDPNLDLIKEITKKPVVGIGEASMKIASILGHRFAIIQTTKDSVPIKEALIDKYHMGSIGFAKAPKKDIKNTRNEDILFDTAKSAIEEDGAEVIILSFAGLTGLDRTLEDKLGVPVLDGIVCGLIIIIGLVKYGISTSKIGKYKPNN